LLLRYLRGPSLQTSLELMSEQKEGLAGLTADLRYEG
jgi:hypothetical protein